MPEANTEVKNFKYPKSLKHNIEDEVRTRQRAGEPKLDENKLMIEILKAHYAK